MYQIHILQSLKDLRTYTGYTKDFKKRFKEHANGKVLATRRRRPFKLLLVENFTSQKEAKQRERWWKSGADRAKLKILFKENFKLWLT